MNSIGVAERFKLGLLPARMTRTRPDQQPPLQANRPTSASRSCSRRWPGLCLNHTGLLFLAASRTHQIQVEVIQLQIVQCASYCKRNVLGCEIAAPAEQLDSLVVRGGSH
jgi:hypothetical protein